MNASRSWTLLAGVSLLVSTLSGGEIRPAPPNAAGDRPDAAGYDPASVRYDRDIRPILSDRCFRCHGPDSAKRQSDLRLDTFEGATAARKRGAAITPGRPDESLLWARVNHTDPDEVMPPPASAKKPLSDEEKAKVRAWIESGATYESHWSFAPPRRPAPPLVADSAWPRNAIDRFVLARLEDEGLTPGAEAPAEVLCRRLFLDLTGLPPTPEEIDAFVAAGGAAALDRWVEKLWTEEPYRSRHAERLAMPWLDAARYADTCGIHMDAGRTIWPWRDWLLRALRDNMPFDRFVVEQIAGDLLPDATLDQKVASGFNRNHVTTDEGGAIAEEYLVEYAVERASTTGSVLLGLTLGCARCHEHKYDPVSQEEFYGVYAYFNSIEEPGLYSQLPDAKRAFEPFLEVPSPEQAAEKRRLEAEVAAAKASLDAADPAEEGERKTFLDGASERWGIRWPEASTRTAASSGGATLTVQEDGSVLASGANPAKDDHTITLRTEGTGLRLVLLEALTDKSLPRGLVGRSPNGNAVLTGIEVEAASVADPAKTAPVRLVWAWADHEQPNGDFAAVNALDGGDDRGWAVNAHGLGGERRVLFLAAEPFGFEGGTELRVKLSYRSRYAEHVLGRVRLRAGAIGESGLAALPEARSGWYAAGPFPLDDRNAGYATAFGPESAAAIDEKAEFGAKKVRWKHDPELKDARVNALADGTNVSYVARRVFAPTARRVEASIGSDDGFQVFLDGVQVAAREVERGAKPDQDRIAFDLPAGAHLLVFKVVNTGGDAGFYWRGLPRDGALDGDLALALLPAAARGGEYADRLARGWRLRFSPAYRAKTEALAGLEKSLADLEKAIPRTMVMREREKYRETYLLVRGAYDKPDKKRPIKRGIPAALGKLPDGAPDSRLGLAQWLVSKDNPLVARVAVNRLWEMVFGAGLVRTSEDFGMQGEWPSHPELLDWLAVEFQECGFDVRHVLRLILGSRTWRQESRARPEASARDPENRLLAWSPRRRLPAEQIRDGALFAGGLLVERFGGASVKPYQPDGLWQEVAMVQSNTRLYERGQGEDLWRRSLYTYWKRACPPPSLMTFDAPTREFCTIRRPVTNTPLQALVLWNDVQFVEAARALAQRTLAATGDDRARLVALVRRCTSRTPDDGQVARLAGALEAWRERYRAAPADADALLRTGEAPRPADPALEAAELAAWTMVANAVLNLDATLCRS